jgi:hypothetical protein
MYALPQAIVLRTTAGPRLAASSPGFPFAHEEGVLRIAVRFGRRPVGVFCPAALFACPLDGRTVAVVQVADRPADGPDPPLAFRFVLFDRGTYTGDPFSVADQFPPNWSAPSPLPELEWIPAFSPPRTVEHVRAVLKAGEGPLLLGAAQALVDGGHVAVARSAPDADFVHDLWQLLPDRVRAELWPATFAFSAELGFHAVVLPSVPPGYLTEEQAKDYPEGRYELALQTAAESGDQAELNRLFARKTSKEVLWLAALMVAFALVVAGVMKFL